MNSPELGNEAKIDLCVQWALATALGEASIPIDGSGNSSEHSSVLGRIVGALRAKEEFTIPHCVRACSLACCVAEALGLDTTMVNSLQLGGLLHDIGKLCIPNSIILKNSALDEEDWDVVQRHPEIGARVLSRLGIDALAIEVVRHHHERFDGSGYPRGLKGEATPFLARLFTIADCLDALVSTRPYGAAWSADEAMRWISGQAGLHFDPALVAVYESRPVTDWLDRAVLLAERYVAPGWWPSVTK